MTFVGDSVAASLGYVPSRGQSSDAGSGSGSTPPSAAASWPSCVFQGAAPSTALQAVQSYGHSLGDVLIVKVGYNEGAGTRKGSTA